MTNEITIPGRLIDILKKAKKVLVFTGAGVSAESGIPTFRDAMTGLWIHYDAEDLATPAAFREDKALVWGWYEWRRSRVLLAQPNPAHAVIASFERHFPEMTVVTQNVDDLHERAGSQSIVHLHGQLARPRCFACGHPFEHPPGIPDEPEGGRCLEPPVCEKCGGNIRPGVVWFGEAMPDFEWKKASRLAGECDVMFSIGTSSMVYPAAQLPVLAATNGATVVQVNPCFTGLDRHAKFNLVGSAGTIMPSILAALEG